VIAKKPRPYVGPQEPRTWGEHLRRQRILRGLLQKEVANEIGVDPFTVLNWERGKCEPKIRFIPAITTFLGYCPWTAPATPGDRFRMTREGLGLSQAQAASLVGCDPATLSRWETGERRPPVGYRRRLLDAVHANPCRQYPEYPTCCQSSCG
jgi:transcriptional regulator with XRE-family HTH domain